MIIYKCDMCKQTFDKNDLTIMVVPLNKYQYTVKNGVRIDKKKVKTELSNIDVCSVCASHIADFLELYKVTR